MSESESLPERILNRITAAIDNVSESTPARTNTRYPNGVYARDLERVQKFAKGVAAAVLNASCEEVAFEHFEPHTAIHIAFVRNRRGPQFLMRRFQEALPEPTHLAIKSRAALNGSALVFGYLVGVPHTIQMIEFDQKEGTIDPPISLSIEAGEPYLFQEQEGVDSTIPTTDTLERLRTQLSAISTAPGHKLIFNPTEPNLGLK